VKRNIKRILKEVLLDNDDRSIHKLNDASKRALSCLNEAMSSSDEDDSVSVPLRGVSFRDLSV